MAGRIRRALLDCQFPRIAVPAVAGSVKGLLVGVGADRKLELEPDAIAVPADDPGRQRSRRRRRDRSLCHPQPQPGFRLVAADGVRVVPEVVGRSRSGPWPSGYPWSLAGPGRVGDRAPKSERVVPEVAHGSGPRAERSSGGGQAVVAGPSRRRPVEPVEPPASSWCPSATRSSLREVPEAEAGQRARNPRPALPGRRTPTFPTARESGPQSATRSSSRVRVPRRPTTRTAGTGSSRHFQDHIPHRP